ncbi:MAG: hypothetical protein NTZ73_04545 [Candidatus Diapherotrites archaeon]|nr:hypothetical protein [Candidatus Diapherotrites archaeon]
MAFTGIKKWLRKRLKTLVTAPKVVASNVAMNKTNLRITRKRGRYALPKKNLFAYSPEMKDFVRKNKGILIPTYRLIEKNKKRLEKGEIISDRKRGIKIQHGATGTDLGSMHEMLLKVTAGNKEFFVKTYPPGMDVERTANAYLQMEGVLESINHRIGKINIRTIKPNVIYGRGGGSMYFVTDFFNKGEVVQLRDSKIRFVPAFMAMLKLKKAVESAKLPVYCDIGTHNMFYIPETKTILLYDL